MVWPRIRTNEFLRQNRDTETVKPNKLYRLLGVRLEGKGPFIRAEKFGSEVRAKRLQKVDAGDFVYSRLFAWRGAIGLIPADMDGAYVSNEFPNFKIAENRVLPRFLELYFRQRKVWNRIAKHCRGTTTVSRNRFKEEFFLDFQISIPPLDGQKWIVSKVDRLLAHVNNIEALQQQAERETEELFSSVLRKCWSKKDGWSTRPLGELTTTVSGQVDPKIEPYVSLPHINGSNIESGTCRLLPYRLAKDDGVKSGKYHFRPNAILYSKIRPYLRKAVQVPFEGICSADVYAFDRISPEIEPRFLMYSLIAPDFCSYANSISGRTRMPKLNKKQLFAFQMFYPSLERQREIAQRLDTIQGKAKELKNLQTETRELVEELFPSILDRALKGEL